MSRRWLIALLVLLVLLSGVSLFVGARRLTLDGLIANQGDQVQVFLASRLPRLIAVLSAGMGLSVTGLIMQRLARNRFVSPSTSGTMESAGLGMLVALVAFDSATVLQKMGLAFAFALAGALLFMRLVDLTHYRDALLTPLIGIVLAGIIGSVTTFLALRFDLVQTLARWMYGDFSGVLRGRYELLYVAVAASLAAYAYADRFTIVGLGEDVALNLGLSYRQVMVVGLGLIALVTAAVIVTVGAIPFLGLIVPNIVVLMMGDNIKRVLPATALMGMAFALAGDVVGRVVRFPYEIPISLIVGVIGSAVFLILIVRQATHVPEA